MKDKVLIIGSGVAGMVATLMLTKAGRKVVLVEKLSLIGGKVIKNEETFPSLECSTCLVAPIQQDILQDKNVDVHTLSTVQEISGTSGNFKVKIHKKARYVDLEACLGCGACYPVCPVSQTNEWEENLTDKKAIYVPTAGSLPNVPVIDADKCLHLTQTEECNKCEEACMFGALKFDDKNEDIEVEVESIIVATGYDTFDVTEMQNLGYGKISGVYTALEFERLFASNGPTEGKITLRNTEKSPESIAIIHCVGREKMGYCSSVCCTSSSKHAHFLKDKLPEAKLYNFYHEICLPDKTYQKFHEEVKAHASEFIFQADRSQMKISEKDNKINISYIDKKEQQNNITVDMVILANAMVPSKSVDELYKIAGIESDKYGFVSAQTFRIGSVETSKPGIFVAGCAEGPKDIQSSVIQSQAAVGKILALDN